MRKFKVIALSVGGLNNKIFRSGDMVQENNFPQGNVDTLVKEGFLKEIQAPKKQPRKRVAKKEMDK